MQLADFLCYIVLTITVTATCAREEQQNKEVEESPLIKRITKRDATILLDLGDSAMDKIFQRPKVIYRRLSKSRYGPSNTRFGSIKPSQKPSRQKNRPHKVTRKPGKKGRTGKPKSSSPKYEPNKKRTTKNKPKYGVPKFRPNSRPGFGHVVKMPHYSLYAPYRSSGFGEPPANLFENQLNPDTYADTYAETLVDSYGAPLKSSTKDVYSTPFTSQEPTQHYDTQDYKKQDQPGIKKFQNSDDTTYAFTKKDPLYSIFVTPTPKNIDSLDPTSDKQMDDNKFFYRKKRPFYFADIKAMNVNRPWKPSKINEYDKDVVVGGQYAEPPARYVSKFIQHSPIYEDDEDGDTFPALHGYVDTEMALSSYSSPYSNYRHGNIAFSPQNLNDAFSTADK